MANRCAGELAEVTRECAPAHERPGRERIETVSFIQTKRGPVHRAGQRGVFGSVSYANAAGFAHAEEIHRVFNVVQQSRFAAVLSTAAWLECVAKRSIAQRDSIHSSHQRALNLIAPRTAALCNHG
jgi:hypothetical protein